MGAGAISAKRSLPVQSFSARDMNRFGTASLITRNTNDIQQIQLFLNGADDDGDRTDHVCGWHHPRDSRGCATLDAAPGRGAVMAVFIGIVMGRVIPQFRSMQLKMTHQPSVREQITGCASSEPSCATIRSAAFRRGERGPDNTALRVNRVFALMLPTMMMILNLSRRGAVGWGRLVSEGSMRSDLNGVPYLYLADPALGDDGGDGAILLRAPRRVRARPKVLLTVPVVSDPASPSPSLASACDLDGSLLRVSRQRAPGRRGTLFHLRARPDECDHWRHG